MLATIAEYGAQLEDALALVAASTATLQPAPTKPADTERRKRHKDPPFFDNVPMDKSAVKKWDGKEWHFCTKYRLIVDSNH